MDLEDQLKQLFPEHSVSEELAEKKEEKLWIQAEPMICKYEK